MKIIVNDFTIKVKLGDFATLQTTGNLIGIHATTPQAAKTHLVAPGTTEQVKQFYIPASLVGQDVKAEQLLTRDMCDSAVIIKDKMTAEVATTVIPKDAAEAIHNSGLPKNVMNVTVHTQADVDAVMFPMKDTQSYVFYPALKDPDNVQNYNLLAGILNDSDLAFCSVVNLQNHEGLFRLQMWRGRIVLVRQGWPEQINPHKAPTEDEFGVAPIPAAVVEKAVKGFNKMVEPLDPETYRDRILAEKVALKEATDNGTVVVKEKAQPTSSSLEDLLAAFDD